MNTKHKSNMRRNTTVKRTNNRRTTNRKYNTEKSRKRKPYIFYLIVIAMVLICIYKSAPQVIELNFKLDEIKEEQMRQIVKEEVEKATKLNESEMTQITEQVKAQIQAEQTQPQQPETQPTISSRGGSREIVEEQPEQKLTGYRLTSYYPGDGCASTTKTGSGKSTKDFNTMKIGNKSVYTYKGKIVVACATKELKKSGYNKRGSQDNQDKYYFSYNETMTLTINGQTYEAICLDSCGAAMWKGQYRVDIMVPSSSDVIDISNTEIILK